MVKPIPIEYIKEQIQILKECKNDKEVPQNQKMVNELWCNARINAYEELIEYWREDMEEYDEVLQSKSCVLEYDYK